MIQLIVLSAGPKHGYKIPITLSCFLIGRDPRCNLIPTSPLVSMRHCALTFQNGLLYVHDLNSEHGTRLNDQLVTGEAQIENGDVLHVGPLDFLISMDKDIYAVFDGSTPVPHKHHDLLDSDLVSPKEKVRRLAPHSGSVEEELRRIHDAIIHDHLYYPEHDVLGLTQRLLDSGSPEYKELSDSFHRLVVLDVSKGMDGTGVFDIILFLRHVLSQMAKAFELQIDENAFHPERIGQILRDEQRSLFCFLHVEHLNEPSFQVLHSFTQQEHRVLYLGQNDYLMMRSFDTAASAKAILEKYLNRWPRGHE